MSTLIACLSRFESGLAIIEKTLLSISLIIMLVLASLQVILRNVFNSGLDSAGIIVQHLVLYLLFFGASLSTRARRHLQMDVSSKIVPKRFRPVISLIIDSFSCAVTLLLLKAAFRFVVDEKLSGSVLFANVETWMVIAIMPTGFLLMSFRFFINILDDLFVLFGKKDASILEPNHFEGAQH